MANKDKENELMKRRKPFRSEETPFGDTTEDDLFQAAQDPDITRFLNAPEPTALVEFLSGGEVLDIMQEKLSTVKPEIKSGARGQYIEVALGESQTYHPKLHILPGEPLEYWDQENPASEFMLVLSLSSLVVHDINLLAKLNQENHKHFSVFAGSEGALSVATNVQLSGGVTVENVLLQMHEFVEAGLVLFQTVTSSMTEGNI